jgi:predicted AAA+ superfamily ATPase
METFKRKIWEKFKAWKEESDGHTALLVEGARRIGKSTAKESLYIIVMTDGILFF